MKDEKSKGKTKQFRQMSTDTPVIEIKRPERLLLTNTVYLTDVVPIVQLLHAADILIGNDDRGEISVHGWREFSVETMNAVELIRKAMSDIIDELHAKIMPNA
jgi:hypothetical protein